MERAVVIIEGPERILATATDLTTTDCFDAWLALTDRWAAMSHWRVMGQLRECGTEFTDFSIAVAIDDHAFTPGRQFDTERFARTLHALAKHSDTAPAHAARLAVHALTLRALLAHRMLNGDD